MTESSWAAPLPGALSATGGASSGPQARGRVRLVALAALLLVFVAGLALGWGLGRRAGGVEARAGTAVTAPPGGREGRRAAFDRRLGLSPAQRASIDSIFEGRRAQIDGFWQGPGRELRVIMDSAHADVRRVLTPAQRDTLEVMRAERERRERERRGGRGAGRYPLGLDGR